MDFTSRMVALLGELRRERNGAVADAMRLYGTPYGLNYGVSLPTLRQIARAEHPDHDFARYLLRQDVRELRLAAFHIAQPERLTLAQAEEWGGCIVNSEIAEEAAFALLSRAPILPELFRIWTATADPLLQYAALMAAARSPLATLDWADTAVAVVRRNALASSDPADTEADRGTSPKRFSDSTEPVQPAGAQPGGTMEFAGAGASQPDGVQPAQHGSTAFAGAETSAAGTDPVAGCARTVRGADAVERAFSAEEPLLPPGSRAEGPAVRAVAPYAAHLTAQGAVALLAALGSRNEENRQAVLRAAGSPGKLPAEDFIHEELAWRLEA